MPEGDEKPKCDIDDLLCQLQVMSHLQGMQSLLGSEKYQARFPEFADLGETVTERIKQQETTIKEAFENCGLEVPAEETVIEKEPNKPSEEQPETKEEPMEAG